jgi:hypothetical protein
MKRMIVVGIASSSLLLATATQGALLLNGDFATPIQPANSFLPVGTHIPGWNVIGFDDVTTHQVQLNTAYWPGNTSQFMDLTGNTGKAGIQSDPFATILGMTYSVTFDAFNGSLVYPGTAWTGTALKVQASGGNPLTSYTVPVGGPQLLTYTFTAKGASTTLTFMDATGGDSNAGWIDNVSLAVVPEVSTVLAGAGALLILGISGWRARKR